MTIIIDIDIIEMWFTQKLVYVTIIKNICLSGGDNMITQQDYDGMQD